MRKLISPSPIVLRTGLILFLLAGGMTAAGLAAAANPEAERFWPKWRGPYATGVSARATPPLEWGELGYPLD